MKLFLQSPNLAEFFDMNVLYEFGEACASSSPERLIDISGLSEDVDTFVFDCDGVIW